MHCMLARNGLMISTILCLTKLKRHEIIKFLTILQQRRGVETAVGTALFGRGDNALC